MENNKDPMEYFDFDESEYQEISESIRKNKNKLDIDRRICACGHPMSRHKSNPFAPTVAGRPALSCQLPNSVCTCKLPRAVLKVGNTKNFLMKPIKETGSSGHPLLRGIRSVRDKSEDEYRQIEWLIPMRCDKCQAEDVKITPLGFFIETERRAEDNKAGDTTIFLCDSCRFPVETSENAVVDSEDSSDNPEL